MSLNILSKMFVGCALVSLSRALGLPLVGKERWSRLVGALFLSYSLFYSLCYQYSWQECLLAIFSNINCGWPN